MKKTAFIVVKGSLTWMGLGYYGRRLCSVIHLSDSTNHCEYIFVQANDR